MGYYTGYSLETTGAADRLAIIKELRDKYEDAAWALTENGDREASCKWYDHDEHLLAFSKEHPDVLFTLHGEGEEQPDLWTKYYKNGKKQLAQAVITYEPFDESKLT